ncbi:MAG: ribokinase, partial [Planctomycetes bacterium]|nr:ribokinase [Planctomycetota bacterium]
MKILNFGSLNVDRVFQVAHFVRPGETLGSSGYAVHAGGKGANQSAALALAGAPVWHAGRVGADGDWLLRLLADKGVDVSLVVVGEEPTGQAVIQVDAHGENALLLDGGANRAIASGQIASTLAHFGPGDVVLLQNEISRLGEIIAAAAAKGLKVWLNPAPFDEGVARLPLDKVSTVVVNETEGRGLAGLADGDAEAVLA